MRGQNPTNADLGQGIMCVLIMQEKCKECNVRREETVAGAQEEVQVSK